MPNHVLEGYQPFWKREKTFVVPRKPLILVVCAWLSVLCLITLIHLLNYWMAKDKEAQTQQTLDLLIKKYTPTQTSFIAALSAQDKREQQNSAQYFDYLATFPHPGYWLTHISLNLSSGVMQFTGHTINTNSVDDLFAHLSLKNSPLTHWTLSAAQLTQSKTTSETTSSVYDFSFNAMAPWAASTATGAKS